MPILYNPGFVQKEVEGAKRTSKTISPTLGSGIENCSSKWEVMLAMLWFEDMSSMPHNIDNSIFVKSLMPKEIGAKKWMHWCMVCTSSWHNNHLIS